MYVYLLWKQENPDPLRLPLIADNEHYTKNELSISNSVEDKKSINNENPTKEMLNGLSTESSACSSYKSFISNSSANC